MARQFTRLRDIQLVPTTVGAIYTNPASSKTFIQTIWLFNFGPDSKTVKLHNVPNAGADVGVAADGNQFDEIILPSKGRYKWDVGYPAALIELNDSIQAVTTATSTVTVMLFGDIDS